MIFPLEIETLSNVAFNKWSGGKEYHIPSGLANYIRVVYLLNSQFKGEKKFWDYFQPAVFTCWKLTVETLKQNLKYVES